MKVGWSIQRHVSVRGVVELLTMLASGQAINDLESEYYSRMGHSFTIREKNEEIFSRNVQFLRLYLEVLDDEKKLKREFRDSVRTEEAAEQFLYERSLENLLAFREFVKLNESSPDMNTKELQRALAKNLLEVAGIECPKEHKKKLADLRKKYGSEDAWFYPHASLDRLREIASIGRSLVGQDIESVETVKNGKESPLLFKERVYDLYRQIVTGNSQQIVGVDAFKERYLTNWPISSEDFDDLFVSLLESDKSILEFSGQIGDEVGVRKRNGRHVYRFVIQV